MRRIWLALLLALCCLLCMACASGETKQLVTADGLTQLAAPGTKMKICAFLWTYYGYPNSNYEGKNVEVMRYRNGEIMARKEMEAGTMDQVLAMVQSNLGVGFYPESMAASALAAGTVFQIRLAEPIPERFVNLIEDTSRPQSVAMKAFKKMLLAPEEE